MVAPISLFSVNAILILDHDASRIVAKYFSPPHPPSNATPQSGFPGINPYPNVKDQKTFERGLVEKTTKQNSDIILYDNRTVGAVFPPTSGLH